MKTKCINKRFNSYPFYSGSEKVPLGSLRINRNKIDCDCSSVVDLVEFLDYEQPGTETNLGEFVLNNEFYSSSFCKEVSNSDFKTLLEFSRENIEHTDKGEKKEELKHY